MSAGKNTAAGPLLRPEVRPADGEADRNDPGGHDEGAEEWEWPGNIRELANFIERAVILTRGRSLEAPLTELAKFTITKQRRRRAPQDREEIARIVKETINALDGKRQCC